MFTRRIETIHYFDWDKSILNIPWPRLLDSVASAMLEKTKKKAMRSEKLILAVTMNTTIPRSENETWN